MCAVVVLLVRCQLSLSSGFLGCPMFVHVCPPLAVSIDGFKLAPVDNIAL